MPVWASWTWRSKYLPEEMHLNGECFWKSLGQLQSARFNSSLKGVRVLLGFGLLLRECNRAQEVEDDDPEVSGLKFLLNSNLSVHKGEDVMDVVGLVVSRLQQNADASEQQEMQEKGAEKETDTLESSDIPKSQKKRKRQASGNVVVKEVDQIDEGVGKKEKRKRTQSKRALGLGL